MYPSHHLVRRGAKDDFSPDQVFDRSGPAVLRLITCGGAYDADDGGYQDNLVVAATPPVSAEVAGGPSPWVAVARRPEPVGVDTDPDTDVRAEGEEPMDADELARVFVAGDRRCLEEAYRLWSPLVHGLAHRELGRVADAEDVTQQVFVSAWQSRADYSPARGSLAGWLVGITRHRLVDHQRRQQRQLRLATTLESEAATSPPAAPPVTPATGCRRRWAAAWTATRPSTSPSSPRTATPPTPSTAWSGGSCRPDPYGAAAPADPGAL